MIARFRHELREWPVLSWAILLSPLWLFAPALVGWAILSQPKATAPTSIPQEAAAVEGAIQPLYFFSYGAGSDYGIKCPADKDIDWDFAIIALSDYMEYGEGVGKDQGPAEIQRNFEENCARDMAVYSDAVKRGL